MIAWLQPAALWGLTLIAVPVLIHLLRTRRAPTVPFPSVQFVRTSPIAAIKAGPPSDLFLMAIRAGIVALAVVALAQPLLLTSSRLNAWNARVARAIVVDRSESMHVRTPAGRTANEEAADIASAEAGAAAAAIRIDADDLGEGLRRAARWLETAPPARREAVVVSDFQLGAFDDSARRTLPRGTGLRLVTVGGADAPVTQADGMRLLGAPGIAYRDQAMRLSRDGTEVAVREAADPAGTGLRILGAEANRDQDMLRRAVARAGAPAPAADRPIAIRFANAPAAEAVTPVRERWMIDTIAALERDPELRRLARDVTAERQAPSDAWTVLLRDRIGNPLLRAAALGRELIVDAPVPAASYFAAVTLRSALSASHGPIGKPEQEVLRIPPERLAAWSQAPGPVNADAWRFADSSDARWCWLAVLALLGLEHIVRRRQSVTREEHRAAA
jgi:hypothetical protein